MNAEGGTRLLIYTGAGHWGGAEVFIGHLLSALPDQVRAMLIGVDTDILERIAAERPGTSWHRVRPIKDNRDVSAILQCRQQMAAARPDIIQLNLSTPFADPYGVLAAVTLPRVRTVAVHHLPMAIRSARIQFLARRTARAISAHVAVGTALAKDVEELLCLPAGSVRKIWNGVPPQIPRPVSARPSGAPFVVGAVGRLHPMKGFDVLVRALTRMPHTRAVIVGDGPERAALEHLASQLGVASRLTITGWARDPRVYFAAFDAFAMPSRYEGLPLALLEAMHASCPVVATRVGSISDAVQDGWTGLLVPAEDEGALAAALLRLQSDRALRERLSQAAAQVALARFTTTTMARGYENLYAELLEKPRRFTRRARSLLR